MRANRCHSSASRSADRASARECDERLRLPLLHRLPAGTGAAGWCRVPVPGRHARYGGRGDAPGAAVRPLRATCGVDAGAASARGVSALARAHGRRGLSRHGGRPLPRSRGQRDASGQPVHPRRRDPGARRLRCRPACPVVGRAVVGGLARSRHHARRAAAGAGAGAAGRRDGPRPRPGHRRVRGAAAHVGVGAGAPGRPRAAPHRGPGQHGSRTGGLLALGGDAAGAEAAGAPNQFQDLRHRSAVRSARRHRAAPGVGGPVGRHPRRVGPDRARPRPGQLLGRRRHAVGRLLGSPVPRRRPLRRRGRRGTGGAVRRRPAAGGRPARRRGRGGADGRGSVGRGRRPGRRDPARSRRRRGGGAVAADRAGGGHRDRPGPRTGGRAGLVCHRPGC